MERKKFVIPQLPVEKEAKEESPKQETVYKREPFVSSIFGTKVKDEITFNGAQFGNKGRQYDAFRDREDRVIKDDYLNYVTYRTQEEELKNEYHEKFEVKDEAEKPSYEEKSLPPKEERIVAEFDRITEEKPLKARILEKKPEPIEEKQVVSPKKPTGSKKGKYIAPPLSLLKRGKPVRQSDMSSVQYQRDIIDTTLKDFNIAGSVVHFTKGPTVTQFEVQLDPGVKMQKVSSISSNFMANLKAKSIRIQAPIPGKSTIGIEVPNAVTDLVLFGELLADNNFLNDNKPMNTVLGLDLSGNPVYLNLAKMPHCLIGGTTGSGKSVCINSIIASILYKAHPDDVKLVLIDPKIIEFTKYEYMPHLATPIITEPRVAIAALKWAVDEMENRYKLFRTYKVREYEEYINVASTQSDAKHIPYIVIIIDELADLMLTSSGDIDDYIQRLTQKGRASGIHMIIATQRPSVDVIKGTIKTNIPTRIAFMVKSQVDSSIILDHPGAENLLGHGDMLYNDSVNEQRLQGAYISNEEISAITDYIRERDDYEYMFTQEDLEAKIDQPTDSEGINDPLFTTIARFVVENNSASINRIQKEFGIGFNRAQAIMKGLEELGIVSEGLGSRARNVEVDMNSLEGILDEL